MRELKNAKSIIDELGHLVPVKNKHTVVEARATHVITSAINLIETLKVMYPEAEAQDLTKRLVRAILQEDPAKFHRKLNQIKKGNPPHG
jgi:hypothetical protein